MANKTPNIQANPTQNLKTECSANTVLKIMAINVNSIQTNKRRLELVLRLQLHDPDIALISETKLKEVHKLSLKNYTIIRTDRPKAKQGSGTAIAIKNHIKHGVIYHPSSADNTTLEYTVICLHHPHKHHDKTYIISLYATLDNKRAFRDELDYLCAKLILDNEKTSFVIAGDLNARR